MRRFAGHLKPTIRRWGICVVRQASRSSSSTALGSFGIGPRILFFGGDQVSAIALEAIHSNLELFSRRHCCDYSLTVVCPTVLVKHSGGDEFANPASNGHSSRVSSLPSQQVLQPHSSSELKMALQRHKHHFPVARYCAEHSIPCIPVDHVSSIMKSSLLQQSTPRGCADAKRYFDVSVVVSFRYFLPGKLLDELPPTINLHPSLLPRYRGASPIYSTMLRGETSGGYSIIKILKNELMDCGDVLLQEAMPIPVDSDIRTYFPNVAAAGSSGLCRILFGEDLRQESAASSARTFASRDEWFSHFEASWRNAQVQPNKPVELKSDPFHAPLLDRHRAALCFHTRQHMEVHNTWRAFVGGKHHRIHPTAILDKGATPCAQQQLIREMKKVRVGTESSGDDTNPCSAAHQIARDRLRVTFVVAEAVHPVLVPNSVYTELQEVETRYQAAKGSSILPGSAVFPLCATDVCAVRCKDGWFFWTSGVLQNSTQQPAIRLRQGLAMKCGVVYEGLFCKHPNEA